MGSFYGVLLLMAAVNDGGRNVLPALKPLNEVAAKLNKGMKAFLKGTDPAEAFKPFDLKSLEEAVEIKKQLQAGGVASVTILAMEFEVVLMKEGKRVYAVALEVTPDARTSGILTLKKGRARPSGTPLKDYTAGADLFAKAAKGLYNALQGKTVDKVPFADPPAILKDVPSTKLLKTLTASVAEGKENAPAVLKALPPVVDEVDFKLDDLTFLAWDKAGMAIGTVDGEFRLKKGRLIFECGDFKPFR